MGKKNRAATSNRKSEPPSPASPVTQAKGDAPAAAAEIKQECERALNALRRGNHNKALRLMKDATPKFQNEAVFHRVAGTISAKVAGIIDDPTVKLRHLKNGIDSARKAVSLSPNSAEFSLFYANLLLDVAVEPREFEEVLAECDRALALENPNDPAKDELGGDETVSFSAEAKEARVAQVHSELRAVMQRANIASISSWVKNLGGNGDDKFKLIPLRRSAEDPVETKYLSGGGNVRRPNEIKKATKTPEERRKEIEVRVAAARLLQQKSEQAAEESKGGVGGTGTGNSLLITGSAAASGSGSATPKFSERRRHGGSRRNASISERKDQVRSFWNSVSSELKRGLLSVRVCDLRKHFGGPSYKDGGQVCEVLNEALAFGEMNQTWKFWACCRCGDKFADADAHIQHVIQEHLDNLLPKLQHFVPQCVDSEWEEMLISCSWKPLDLYASVRMLEDLSRPEVPEIPGREAHKELIEDFWSDSFCTEEKLQSFEEKKISEDNCNDSLWEDGNSNIECRSCDRLEVCKVYNHNYTWPLSDDSERARLLEKISSLFQVLLGAKCLSVTHLQKVMDFTIDELQRLSPDSKILSSGVDQTPLCICFLGASSLRKILEFLQEISYASCFGSFAEKVSQDNTSTCLQVLDCEDSIQLNESASSLLLDESLLHVDGVRDDVSSGSSVNGFRKGGPSDSDADPFLSWIYAGSPSAEQLGTWSRIREEKSQEGMQLLEMLGKEFIQLQTVCEKKDEHLGYEEALLGFEELGTEECKKGEQLTEISYRSLRKRRDELLEGDTEGVFVSNRMELDAISSVLKEAESLHTTEFGFEDPYGGVVSHFCDLEAGEEDWRSKDCFQQLDRCADSVLHRQKENVRSELSKLDAQILRRLFNIKQLELQLEPVSTLDYRFILLPLVKSYMRAHLEDLTDKDATVKSDAARDAFLAELALDSKKNTGSGNDHGKNTQEKMKDRKRNKDSRRSKDSKLGSFNDQLEAADQSSLAATSDGDLVDTEIVEPENGNIRELENELRRQIELEAEERKLEETLEYQRRLENEAKQRLLAEQQRRNSLVAFGDALDEPDDVPLGIPGASYCKQEALLWKNVNDFCSHVADGESVGSTNCYLKPELPNSGGPNDGVLPFERQAGKRGKRRNSLKGPEGKNQTVSYGIENVVNSTIDIEIKDQDSNLDGAHSQSVGDGGSKTLRQLQAEEDEEERFQADLKKAVMQSLDTYQARQKMPWASNSGIIHKRFENFGTKADGLTSEIVNDLDLVGLGLQNEVGEYNCFLNVIIQSLWHLRRFREEFLTRSAFEHVHVGDPCVVCALFDILTALSMASGDVKREPVAPSTLRIALSNLCPKSNFFQEGQMNDASEVLAVIFDCLHQSFTSRSGGSDCDSVESDHMGRWDCSSSSCVAHGLFGMDISERMNCSHCGLESKQLKYTEFFRNINASALRTMKAESREASMDDSFDELLNQMEMKHLVACDPEAQGCGKLNHIHHILSKPPHVFTAVLGWQTTCESPADIKETLSTIPTEIDISKLYHGLDSQNPHRLVSVVCYYGQHYHCFAFSHDHDKWVLYDDKTVKVIGSWEEILSMCERGHLQPQVLFYEAVN